MTTRQTRLHVPKRPLSLMTAIYKKILPSVHHQLSYWKRRAEAIPNPELRKQALSSIGSKQFHCEGGGILALLAAPEEKEKVITFIVAYQTISDYLDNLCDRSVSLESINFETLHYAMKDALIGSFSTSNYYLYQEHQEDGGYLLELVTTCRDVLKELPSLQCYLSNMLILCQLYCELQIKKHISEEGREEVLKEWWNHHQETFPQLEWQEFAAATGSTLGIFYYVAISSLTHSSQDLNTKVFEAYFPYVQGLHILLDYLIDQEEDRQGGDLNFCFYYTSEEEKARRLDWFIRRAKDSIKRLPHSSFHKMLVDGLLGIYLADQKVKRQEDVKVLSRRLLKGKKFSTRFFLYNGWLVHRIGKKV
jgi:tetraprenyl-beta-curcumene synthase